MFKRERASERFSSHLAIPLTLYAMHVYFTNWIDVASTFERNGFAKEMSQYNLYSFVDGFISSEIIFIHK